eukprot:3159912-Pyramimonas_sp.AAC.1
MHGYVRKLIHNNKFRMTPTPGATGSGGKVRWVGARPHQIGGSHCCVASARYWEDVSGKTALSRQRFQKGWIRGGPRSCTGRGGKGEMRLAGARHGGSNRLARTLALH